MVSVVIPTFNDEAWLGQTLDSVLAQPVDGLEVIIVDDCGRVPVRDWLDVADARVRIIRHERNAGPGAARTTGLAAAQGRYVHFLDADDLVEPGFLPRALATLAQMGPLASYWGAFAKVDMAFRLEAAPEQQMDLPPPRVLGPGDAAAYYLEHTGSVLFSFSVMSMALLERLQQGRPLLEPDLPNNEDFHFFVRASCIGEAAVDGVPLGHHRLRAASQSRRQAEAWACRAMAIDRLLAGDAPLPPGMASRLSRMRGAACRRRARILAGAGARGEAVRALLADGLRTADVRSLAQAALLVLRLDGRNARDELQDHRAG